METLKKNLKPLTLLLAIPIMNLTYILINNFSTTGTNVTISLDQEIPFLAVFIVPYIFWYLFIPLSFFILCLKDKRVYYKTIFIYIVGCLTASIIFIFYQTTVPRSTVAGNDIFTNIIRMIYANDNPVNCLPSLHVFTSYLVIRAIAGSTLSNFRNNAITVTISVLIIVSTLFTKQHAILDVVSGIILAEILIYFVNRYEKNLLNLWRKFALTVSSIKKAA